MVVVVAVGERREKGEEKECTGRSLYYSTTLLLYYSPDARVSSACVRVRSGGRETETVVWRNVAPFVNDWRIVFS